MSDCEHGFVTRETCGDYKYICHECEERFTAYPTRVDTAPIKPSPIQLVNMQESLKDFTAGMTTFQEAIRVTGHTLVDFKEAVARFLLARNDIEWEPLDSSGSRTFVPVILPPRTSCPAEIDKIFSDPNITLDDLRLITEEFADIKYMDHATDVSADIVTIRIYFMDNSVQKVFYHPDSTSPLQMLRNMDIYIAKEKPYAKWEWNE